MHSAKEHHPTIRLPFEQIVLIRRQQLSIVLALDRKNKEPE